MAFHTMQRAPERVAGVGLSVHYAVLDSTDRVAQCAGFSLHAGVAAEDSQRDKLERLCRYISRPAVAIERSSRLPDGRIRYTLKTPYRDGTTHVLFEQRCPVP
jgi:hypothetical protein